MVRAALRATIAMAVRGAGPRLCTHIRREHRRTLRLQNIHRRGRLWSGDMIPMGTDKLAGRTKQNELVAAG